MKLSDLDRRARTMYLSRYLCPECGEYLTGMGKWLYCTAECGFGRDPMITDRQHENEWPNLYDARKKVSLPAPPA